MVRIPAERCLACDGALRSAVRLVVGGRTLLQCGACGHAQVDDDAADAGCRCSDDGDAAGRWKDVENAVQRLLALRSIGVERGRLLDLGTRSAFGDVARAAPFDVTAFYTEVPNDIATALAASELQPGSFHVATIWGGLEREPEPVRLLSSLRDLLAPGGIVALSVPFAHEGRDWMECRARGVSQFFSIASLRVAVGRAGFDITNVMPTDLRPELDGMSLRNKLAVHGSMTALRLLATDRRYGNRFAPEVLWLVADTAELWAVRA